MPASETAQHRHPSRPRNKGARQIRGRVASGDCSPEDRGGRRGHPPPAPMERSMGISRTTLVRSWGFLPKGTKRCIPKSRTLFSLEFLLSCLDSLSGKECEQYSPSCGKRPSPAKWENYQGQSHLRAVLRNPTHVARVRLSIWKANPESLECTFSCL
jgi:hypothetical protein